MSYNRNIRISCNNPRTLRPQISSMKLMYISIPVIYSSIDRFVYRPSIRFIDEFVYVGHRIAIYLSLRILRTD
jgi:hypothetical protein